MRLKHLFLLLPIFIIIGLSYAFSASAVSYCETASPQGVSCASGKYYCGPTAALSNCNYDMTGYCPTFDPAISAPCTAEDSCGVCKSCATTHNLCGTYPSMTCNSKTVNGVANCSVYVATCGVTDRCQTCVSSSYTNCDSGARCQVNRAAGSVANCATYDQCNTPTQPCSSCTAGNALCATNDTCKADLYNCATLRVDGTNCANGLCATCKSGDYTMCTANNTNGNQYKCMANMTCPTGQTFDPCVNDCVGNITPLKLDYNSLSSPYLINSSFSIPALTINGSHYIGLGTTNPTTTLDIFSARNSSLFAGDKTISGVGLPQLNSDAATKGYVDSAFTSFTASTTNFWGGLLSGNMWSMNTGNVGIGTTTPNAKLRVVGSDSLLTSFAANISGLTGTGLVVANNGAVGIGGSPINEASLYAYRNLNNINFNSIFTVQGDLTDTVSRNINGYTSTINWNPTANVGGTLNASVSQIQKRGDFTIGSANINLASFGSFGNGVSPAVRMYYSRGGFEGGTGSISNLYHFYAESPYVGSGTGTMGTAYGLYIAQQKQAFVSNSYGIYQANVADKNYFAGNVGIGTTNPTTTLDVASSRNLSIFAGNKTISGVSLPQISSDAATKGYVDSATLSSNLWAGTKNGNIWNGDAGAGNVGIGTASPQSPLHLELQANGGMLINRFSAITNDYSGINFSVTPVPGKYAKGGIFFQRTGGTGIGNLVFANNSVADDTNATTSNAVMTLQSGGNVGIGTTNPTTTLAVASSRNLSIFAGDKIVGGIALPQSNSDAATKGYVDTLVLSATSSISGLGVFVGATPATYTGNQGSYSNANLICSNTVASSSHVCLTSEIINTINSGHSNNIPVSSDLWINNGPPGYTVNANDCIGWTSGVGTDRGTKWFKASTGEGNGSLEYCNTPLKFSCCK